jgi:hypothetical protein
VKLIRDLGPLAIVVAVCGALIAFLLSQGNTIGNWLLAAFLFGHGWVHAMYVLPGKVVQPAPGGGMTWPFELSRSWLSSDFGLNAGAVRAVGLVLVVVTIFGFALAALASVPLVVPAAAWAGLVIVASVTSALLMTIFFSPELLVGLGIDAVLMYVAVLRIWLPT